MCRYCSEKDDDTLMPVPEGEEAFCEHCTETLPPCGEPARYFQNFRYVDEHLCREHMEDKARNLEGGLLAIQQAAGFEGGVAVKEIPPEGICEHMDFTGGEPCARPAAYAMLNSGILYLCEKHKDQED